MTRCICVKFVEYRASPIPSIIIFYAVSSYFLKIFFGSIEILAIFALAILKNDGAIAQLVEQRTENPCVPGSIPGGTTKKIANS